MYSEQLERAETEEARSRIRLQRGFWPLEFGENYVLGFTRGEFDEEYVVLFDLEKAEVGT